MRNKGILLVLWMLVIGVVPTFAEVVKKTDLHFAWSANATFTSNYVWRGLYCGGPSLQVDATSATKILWSA